MVPSWAHLIKNFTTSDNPRSTAPKNSAITRVRKTTTPVEFRVASRVGQLTRLNSVCTLTRKSLIDLKKFTGALEEGYLPILS